MMLKNTIIISEVIQAIIFMRRCLRTLTELWPINKLLREIQQTSRTKLYLILDVELVFYLYLQQELVPNTYMLLIMLKLHFTPEKLLNKMVLKIKSQFIKVNWKKSISLSKTEKLILLFQNGWDIIYCMNLCLIASFGPETNILNQ